MRINEKSERSLDVVMCKTCQTCPSVVITKDHDMVVLGGKEEGFSEWTKEQFSDLIEQARNGIFDEYLEGHL